MWVGGGRGVEIGAPSRNLRTVSFINFFEKLNQPFPSLCCCNRSEPQCLVPFIVSEPGLYHGWSVYKQKMQELLPHCSSGHSFVSFQVQSRLDLLLFGYTLYQ